MRIYWSPIYSIMDYMCLKMFAALHTIDDGMFEFFSISVILEWKLESIAQFHNVIFVVNLFKQDLQWNGALNSNTKKQCLLMCSCFLNGLNLIRNFKNKQTKILNRFVKISSCMHAQQWNRLFIKIAAESFVWLGILVLYTFDFISVSFSL